MKRQGWIIPVIILFLAAALTVTYLPLRSSLDFQISDLSESLKQNQGRERKQQAEYDEVYAELPEARAALEALQPQAEEAAERVAALKAERKSLRTEKEALLQNKKEENP